MSWSIFLQGEAEAVKAAARNAKAYGSEQQMNRAKEVICCEIESIQAGAMSVAVEAQHPQDRGQVPEVTAYVTVEASGHDDPHGNNSYSVRVARLNLLV